MWSKPEFITDVIVDKIWVIATSNPALPEMVIDSSNSSEAFNLVTRWVTTVAEMAYRAAARIARPDQAPTPPAFRRQFREWMIGEVQQLERRRRFDLANDILGEASHVAIQAQDQGSQTLTGLAVLLSSCMVALLGSERSMLVGVRGGLPVWKRIARVNNRTEAEIYAYRAPQANRAYLREVSVDESWMVPDYKEWDEAPLQSLALQNDYADINGKLVEAAFYHQRYIVHPEGVEVSVTNAQDFQKVFIKVRSRGHSQLVDILARLETTRGACFIVLNEERLLDPEDQHAGSYPAYLVCQIYHDLVTAEHVRTTTSKEAGDSASTPDPPELSGRPTWIVIPRRVKDTVLEPRSELADPRVCEPHRVTGHLRNVPMTLEHRQALIEYEREWGVQILRFVPEGYTFVRPHMSPAIDPEAFQTLPRFIRYRVQQELERSMRARSLST